MRWNKKAAAALITAGMLVSMGTGVYAGSNLKEIKAYLNTTMKFKMNGQPVQLKNASGAVVAPISYNNTTYLPVRSVSDLLGVAVNFDAASNTVQLGERNEGVPIAVGFNASYHSKDPAVTVYGAKDYKEVFFDNGSGTRGSSFMLYPEKKYQKLVIQVAAIGQDIKDFKIEDTDKDIILKKQDILVTDGLVTIEADIAGVRSLFVHSNVKAGGQVFIPLTTSYFK